MADQQNTPSPADPQLAETADVQQFKSWISEYGKPAAIDNAGRRDSARLVSSEIAGAFCEKLEKAYGVPVIYSVSAGGNQIPRYTALRSEVTADGETVEVDEGPAQGFIYAATLAEEMKAAAMDILDGIKCGEAPGKAEWSSAAVKWERKRGGPRKLTKELSYTPEGETELTADLFALGDTAFVLVRPEMTAAFPDYQFMIVPDVDITD